MLGAEIGDVLDGFILIWFNLRRGQVVNHRAHPRCSTCPPSSVRTYEQSFFKALADEVSENIDRFFHRRIDCCPSFLFWCICHNVDNAQSFQHQINQSTANRFHISHARVIRNLNLPTQLKHHRLGIKSIRCQLFSICFSMNFNRNSN